MSPAKPLNSGNYESLYENFVDPYVVLQLKGARYDSILNRYDYDDDRSDVNDCDPKRIHREDIESSYRRLSVLYHPYRTRHRYQQQLQLHLNNGKENHLENEEDHRKKQEMKELMESNTRFVLIAASYEVLIQEETRQRFDKLSFNLKMKAIRFHQQHQTGLRSLLSVCTSSCYKEPSNKAELGNDSYKNNNSIEKNSNSMNSCFCIIPSETPTSRRRRKSTTNRHQNQNAIGNRHQSQHHKSRYNSILSSTFCQEAFVMNDSFFDVDDDDDDDSCIKDLRVISSDEDDILSHFSSHIHYYDSHCGPLTLLYRARNQQPFTHPLSLFQRVFGNDIFTSRILEPSEKTKTSTNLHNSQNFLKECPLPSSSFTILPFHTQFLYVTPGNDHRGFPYIPSEISASVFLSSLSFTKKNNKTTTINPITTKIKVTTSNSTENEIDGCYGKLVTEGDREPTKYNIVKEIVNKQTRIKRTEMITQHPTLNGNLKKSVVQVERLSDHDDDSHIGEETEIPNANKSTSNRRSLASFFCNPSLAWC